jgi:hypothetical protein
MAELSTATAIADVDVADTVILPVRKGGVAGLLKMTLLQLKNYISTNLGVSAWKDPVRAKTTAALAANTYANGASGVGATLTGNVNGALAAQDGVTLAAGERLLVANEVTGSHNGLYTLTQVGDGTHPYILTRAVDADIAGELVNATVMVEEGSTQADQQWMCTTNAPIVVGTTALVWTQSNPGGGLLASNNLSDVSNPATAGANIRPVECIILACSDETTALTAGTAKVSFRMPYAFTVTEVYASLTTAQASGSIFTVDINEAGVSIISTKLTIDNTELDSDTAATPAVISDASLARRALMTVDIDQIGDGTAKGLKVTLVGHRT